MSKKQLSKTILNSITPKARRCKECPRWETMCKGIYDVSTELPKISECPIWNGSFDIDTQLWYYQSSNDALREDLCDVEVRLNDLSKEVFNTLGLENSYNMIDDKNFEFKLFHSSDMFEPIIFKIEKRKIDWLIHDDEYLYNLLGALDMYSHFAKSYQIMKKRNSKVQLRGGSNRIYIEAYDTIKLDDLIYNLIVVYIRILDGILFELEIADCDRKEKMLKKIW